MVLLLVLGTTVCFLSIDLQMLASSIEEDKVAEVQLQMQEVCGRYSDDLLGSCLVLEA